MSQFVSRWSTWNPGMASHETDKTDTSFAENFEMPIVGTDKTDKSRSVSFVSRNPGGSEENSSTSSSIECTAQVTDMRLDDFAKAGLVVRVHSEVLNTDVLFVSDDIPASKLNGPEVVYRAQELKKLARVPLDPQSLRNLQMVKEILGGTVQDIQKKDSRAEESSNSACVGDCVNGSK